MIYLVNYMTTKQIISDLNNQILEKTAIGRFIKRNIELFGQDLKASKELFKSPKSGSFKLNDSVFISKKLAKLLINSLVEDKTNIFEQDLIRLIDSLNGITVNYQLNYIPFPFFPLSVQLGCINEALANYAVEYINNNQVECIELSKEELKEIAKNQVILSVKSFSHKPLEITYGGNMFLCGSCLSKNDLIIKPIFMNFTAFKGVYQSIGATLEAFVIKAAQMNLNKVDLSINRMGKILNNMKVMSARSVYDKLNMMNHAASLVSDKNDFTSYNPTNVKNLQSRGKNFLGVKKVMDSIGLNVNLIKSQVDSLFNTYEERTDLIFEGIKDIITQQIPQWINSALIILNDK